MDIHIVNGPNLNLLGKRQPEIYGHRSFEDFFTDLVVEFSTCSLSYYQSNHEGSLIDYLQEVGFEAQGIVINPGAYTHTSIALMDTVAAIPVPVVEVHISNIYEREPFRHHSWLKEVAVLQITGKGLQGYKDAIRHLIKLGQS